MKIYMVGGAVRDMLMGKEPSDRDYVVVGATPELMIHEGYEQVGAAFPVFLHAVTREEYALARTERKVGDGYLGFETSTDGVTLEEDLSRRDFTVNAMAFDVETSTLIDPFGGADDIKRCTLRHVGPAFREDPLRVVRMARFLARFLNFQVADETFLLASQMVRAGELNELSWERFGAEIRKVLDTCTPDGCFRFFDVLHKLRVDQHVGFFRGVDLMQAALAAKAVKLKLVDAMRAPALGAMTFDGEAREHVGGSLARDVGEWLVHLRQQPATASGAFEALRSAGAWGNSPTWTLGNTVLQLLQRDLHLNTVSPFTWAFLLHAQAVSSPAGRLGAELAARGVPGHEIGERIQTARHEAIAGLF